MMPDLLSAGGRRLLRSWLCRPLGLHSIAQISERQDAVDELAARPELLSGDRAHLQRTPDLERALGQLRNAAAAPAVGLPAWARRAAQTRWGGKALSPSDAVRRAAETRSASTVGTGLKGCVCQAGWQGPFWEAFLPPAWQGVVRRSPHVRCSATMLQMPLCRGCLPDCVEGQPKPGEFCREYLLGCIGAAWLHN